MFIRRVMRYTKLIPILLVAIGVISTTNVVAQEHKRVEVTTIYTPEVASSTKLDVPASIAEKSNVEPDIVYNVHPDTWQIKLEDHNFTPAKASFWTYDRAERFYVDLASGYPLVSNAEFKYMTQNVRLGYMGFDLAHDGNFSKRINGAGVERYIADSYDMRNRVSVNGGLVSGCQMLEGSINYDIDIYNRYASLDNPQRLYFHDADIALRYGDSFADLSRLNFAVEAHGGYWSHTPPPQEDVYIPTSEFRAGGSARLMRSFSDNIIGLRAEYDMWQNVKNSYRDMRIGATVQYARDFGFIAVDASLGYLYDRVRDREKPSHFILPRLRMDFDFGLDALQPYIDINTTVSQNGISELYKVNPFIDYDYSLETLLAMPNTRSYNLSLGIAGVAFSSHLSYRIYGGVNFMRDQVLWFINEIGTFGVAAADNNRFVFGAEVEYRPVGGLSIDAKFMTHADNSTGSYIVSEARMSGNLNVKYSLKRWKFYVSGNLIGHRHWSAIDNDTITYEAFTAPTVFDLGAGVSFKASSSVEVYLNGCNLLNQNIYDYAYYYRNSIGAMAGVKIDF